MSHFRIMFPLRPFWCRMGIVTTILFEHKRKKKIDKEESSQTKWSLHNVVAT
jgi:hypothetical protein